MKKLPAPLPTSFWARLDWSGRYARNRYPRQLTLSKDMALKVIGELRLVDEVERLKRNWDFLIMRAYCTADRYWSDRGLEIAVNFKSGGNTSLTKTPRQMARVYLGKLLRHDSANLHKVRQKTFYVELDKQRASATFIFPYHDDYIKRILLKRRWFDDIENL